LDHDKDTHDEKFYPAAGRGVTIARPDRIGSAAVI
jgi:hypothetical protein